MALDWYVTLYPSSPFLTFLFFFGPGRVAEQMGDLDHALSAYENALRHNPMSMSGLQQVAGISRIKENYPKVISHQTSRCDAILLPKIKRGPLLTSYF